MYPESRENLTLSLLEDVRGFRLQPLRERLQHVAFSDFARITYTEAIEILKGAKDKEWEVQPEWGIDLGSEHERWMAEGTLKISSNVFPRIFSRTN